MPPWIWLWHGLVLESVDFDLVNWSCYIGLSRKYLVRISFALCLQVLDSLNSLFSAKKNPLALLNYTLYSKKSRDINLEIHQYIHAG
jgi:hypothetical protein